MTSNIIKLFISGIFIVAVTFSCSSRDNEINSNAKKGTFLKLNVSGIIEGKENKDIGNYASISQKGGVRTLKESEEKIFSLKGIDFLVDNKVQYLPSSKSKNEIASLNSSSLYANNSKISVKPIEKNITFKLFVYDMSDSLYENPVIEMDNLSKNKDSIDSGKKYKWIAYSMHDQNPLPKFSENGTLSSEDLKNKDFLYASGNFETKEGENTLNIQFKRMTAKINLTIDSRGMSGPINETEPLLNIYNMQTRQSIFNYGEFNLFNNKYTKMLSFSPPFKPKDSLRDPDAGSDKYFIKKYQFNIAIDKAYSIKKDSLKTLLKMSVLRKDPGTSNSQNLVIPDIVSLKNLDLSIENGNIYTFNLIALESAVTLNGVKWARSNLMGLPTLFRMSSDNKWYNPNGSYTWPEAYFKGSLDPCTQIYPSVWRLPTTLELDNAFNNPTSEYVRHNASNASSWDGLFGIEFKIPGDMVSSFPQYSQNLFFPSGGYQSDHFTNGIAPTSNSGYNHLSTGTIGGYYIAKDGTQPSVVYFKYTNNGSANTTGWQVHVANSPADFTNYRYFIRCVRK
ncbi:hypothetical protein [Elizabethkingia ursingii]|uniref:Fibrobacter succinogenes major paralogous domain-containing protein n=1 Tax=Elizabethkingia ursingii TaxID=1756150 RepID=A0ABX3N7X2_9FLAO|nr:hypothetical protein [Elizabethkingia ursingii]OPB88674.1 hypothetical protein BB021_04645 [Elizabethkingia ursingii]